MRYSTPLHTTCMRYSVAQGMYSRIDLLKHETLGRVGNKDGIMSTHRLGPSSNHCTFLTRFSSISITPHSFHFLITANVQLCWDYRQVLFGMLSSMRNIEEGALLAACLLIVFVLYYSASTQAANL